MAPERRGGFCAASGDLRASLHTDTGALDPRGALPGALKGIRRHVMRGLEKGERHPALGGHDVRFGPDQPGRTTLTQHYPRCTCVGHLLKGYIRSGAVLNFCASPHHKGHLRREVYERGAAGVCQA